MADPDIKTNAPSTGNEDTQTPKPNVTDDWKSITGNKYQSEADLAKAYKELESKYGQQSEDIRKGREFAETVAPVLDIIKNDPDAFKLIDEKLRNVNTPEKGKDKSVKQEKKQQEVREAAQDILIDNLESKYGFKDLSKEEQESLRNKIGFYVTKMTKKNILDVDLRDLRSVYEDAYTLTMSDKRTDQDEETIPNGAFSSIPSSKGKGETKLTQEERTVASKLGLTTEQYLAGKKQS